MKTQRRHEGEIVIDHRHSPGIRPEDVAHMPDVLAVPGGRLYESATYTCSHCQVLVVINPKRTRERGYCQKCDKRLCDVCEFIRVATGGACRVFERVIDRVQEANVKKGVSVI